MYYSMHDWMRKGGIDVKLLPRDKAFEILKNRGFPVIEIRKITASDLEGKKLELIKKYLSEKGPFLILALPLNKNLKKEGAFDMNSVEDIKHFISKLEKIDLYDISLTQQVKGIVGGFIGIAIKSENQLYVELLVREGITDVRELSSGHTNTKELIRAHIDKNRIFGNVSFEIKKDLIQLGKDIGPYEGYYEFIKGRAGDVEGVWFVDYQTDRVFTNMFNSKS